MNRDPAYDSMPDSYEPDDEDCTDDDCDRDFGLELGSDRPTILSWIERALGPRDV
jgi:hypothetical protein